MYPQTPGFEFEAECVRFIDDLKRRWSPVAQTLSADGDRAAISAKDGRLFEYDRVGYDHRPMVFRAMGRLRRAAPAVSGTGRFVTDGL